MTITVYLVALTNEYQQQNPVGNNDRWLQTRNSCWSKPLFFGNVWSFKWVLTNQNIELLAIINGYQTVCHVGRHQSQLPIELLLVAVSFGKFPLFSHFLFYLFFYLFNFFYKLVFSNCTCQHFAKSLFVNQHYSGVSAARIVSGCKIYLARLSNFRHCQPRRKQPTKFFFTL